MADQFDIVDIVYDAVEPVSTSFILYKDRSGDGETKNHITIRMLTLNETEVVNKGSVNINVFVKNQAKGRPDRQLTKGGVIFRSADLTFRVTPFISCRSGLPFA